MSAGAEVRVPGSTSNLGAGFDCVGVAVDRWLTLTATIDPDGGEPVRLRRAGTLAGLTVAAEHDRIVAAFRAACREAGRAFPDGLSIRATSDIPVARGLGSSAAATVAGAAAANALLRLGFDDQALIELCAALEGHPDNVVPAVHGGATLAVSGEPRRGTDTGGRVLVTAPIELHDDLALALAVPDFEVETSYMRAVLPASVPHAVAARAAALAAALVAGLTSGHPGLLEHALEDVLHVPFRRELVPGYDAVVAAAREAGAFGATLSGSGSSLCAVTPRDSVHEVAAAMCAAWTAIGIRADAIACDAPAAGYSVAAHRESELSAPGAIRYTPDSTTTRRG
ncbi:MAG TPA: homoserine kinase [Gemmatimonadaceae bacterium]|nr:homoserine kinase [Gemmatimonadaceae bacterium]